jgi:hypothetical protein
MEWDLLRITDRSLCTGIEGITYYINKRISSPRRQSDYLPFDKAYLTNWKSAASSISIPKDKVVLDEIIDIPPDGDDITSWRLGLKNGCAGVGFKLMEL